MTLTEKQKLREEFSSKEIPENENPKKSSQYCLKNPRIL